MDADGFFLREGDYDPRWTYIDGCGCRMCLAHERSRVTPKRRWGLKGKNQLPLLMVWDEFWHRGEVIHASVVFNSRDWIGF